MIDVRIIDVSTVVVVVVFHRRTGYKGTKGE
jgi:hypothetical protein